ncbi:MAG: helix-turn-helix domain-containing protein [Syntrophales bacterium]
MSAKELKTEQDGLKDIIESYERDLIVDALKITFGNQSHAAKLLKTTKRIFNYKVHKYEINLTDFRLKRLKSRKDAQKSMPGGGNESGSDVHKIP